MRYLIFSLLFLISVTGVEAQNKNAEKNAGSVVINKNLSDSGLLDLVQKQTIKYFWDFAHPVSGMAASEVIQVLIMEMKS